MKRVLIFALLLGALLAAGAVFLFAALSIPDFGSLEKRRVVQSTKIYDRTGEIVLYDVYKDVKRTVIPFEEIPDSVKHATIAIEDADFYRHHGIRLSAIARAFIINLLSGEIRQGGSTITQQLVKNTFLTFDRTWVRKIKEVVLAFKAESAYEKDEILTLYLNEIPYGANIYGVEEASRTFFGKLAKDITLAEAAYLASLPKAPTKYSPYGSNRALLEARKDLVLSRMRELGYISEEEYRRAKNEKVVFLNRGLEGLKAPHFTMYVREYLVEKYGEDTVEKGGLKVITTVNLDWQKKAEEIVKKYAEENEKKFNAKNAGLVAIDPKTGQILTLVGSRDYFNFEAEGNFNIALARRQPGSAFKPFVYTALFQKGYAPETVVFDLFTEFNSSCLPDGSPPPGSPGDVCYHPQNYDEKFRGPVSLREALAQSLNIPAVKVLYLAGMSDALKVAQRAGILTLTEPERYGLTLVLGGGEVRLLELTGGYGAFANDGLWHPATAILRVEDHAGLVLEEYQDKKTQAAPPEIARMISSILSDNTARAPLLGPASPLYFPDRPMAAKTGTSNDSRDAWVIGYTPNMVAGVWAGNNDNSPMEKKVAGLIVAPMWNAFMKEVLKDLPVETFIPPPIRRPEKPILRGEWRGGRVYVVDKLSGKLATEFTPEETREERVIPEVRSILYWVDKEDPLGPPPSNPTADPQFNNWEASVRNWADAQGYRDETDAVIPKEEDDLHKPDSTPKGEFIITPDKHSITPGGPVTVSLTVESKFPIEQVDMFWGGQFLGSGKAAPYRFSFTASGSPGESIELYARIYDQVKNTALVSEIITLKE